MSYIFELHPENPQVRLLHQIAQLLERGGVMVYPTESGYALGCRLSDKAALVKIRQIRALDAKHLLTLMCRNLEDVSAYAKLTDMAFQVLKKHTPGPYTFVLDAKKTIPKVAQEPKRKTIGVRISAHPIVRALLDVLELPFLSTSLRLPGLEIRFTDPNTIREMLGARVEILILGGVQPVQPTSLIDCTESYPKLVRKGFPYHPCLTL